MYRKCSITLRINSFIIQLYCWVIFIIGALKRYSCKFLSLIVICSYEDMLYLGILGFVFLFIYDLNQILFRQKILKVCFAIGIFMIILTTVIAVFNPIKSVFGIFIAVIALCYTIYALFFALDFNDTYIGDKYQVNDKGLYALCRHPGFYGLLGIYLGLFIAYRTNLLLVMFVVYNLLNFIYILFEDLVVFPQIFDDYDRYKKEVPFLIPSKKSIRKCLFDRG